MQIITQSGISIDTLATTQKEIEDQLKALLGNDIDLQPDQPLGVITGILSKAVHQVKEQQPALYNQFDPDQAFGNGLSGLVRLNSIERKPATFSTVILTLSGGTIGDIIPSGSSFSSDTNIVVTTTEDVMLSADAVTVEAVCTVAGAIGIPVGSIKNVDNPLGAEQVTNLESGVRGDDEETDMELRLRRNYSTSLASSSNEDGIRSVVLNIPEVSYVKVYENDTDTVDPITNTPPNSFQCVVYGGEDQDVADKIFSKKPVGIPSFGSTTVGITDESGNIKKISFTRPTNVPIYVNVEVKAKPNSPSNLQELIKKNIVEYAVGNLFTDREYGINTDIPVNQINTPINRIDYVEYIDSLEVDKVNPPVKTKGLVSISYNELPEFTEDNIKVTLI